MYPKPHKYEVSAELSDVIHHVEERLERIRWTMGSPRPTGVYSECSVCTGVYRSVQEYLGIQHLVDLNTPVRLSPVSCSQTIRILSTI